MASSSGVQLLLLPLSVAFLVHFTSANASLKSSSQLINEVCPKSRNPSLCFQALRSDPRAANADLVGLGNISINLSQDSVQSTSKLIDSLAKKTSDPVLKGKYNSCLENFGDATDSLNESEESLRSGDYASINFSASAASTDAETCQDTFNERPGTGEPEELKQAIQKAEDLCSIILVISNRLSGRPL